MTAKIAHGAAAEIPPAIPLWPGKVDVTEWPLRDRSQPEVPVQRGGNGGRDLRPLRHENDVFVALRRLPGLQTPGPRNPYVTFTHRPDRPALHEFDDPPIVFRGMDLCPHLRGHTRIGGSFTNDPHFPDRMREGFLTVDMLLQL